MVTRAQKKLENYYKIFEQVHESSRLPIQAIADNVGLINSTVSKYLKEMYEKTVMTGPFLEMRSTQTYKEHVYLMNFDDPRKAFETLKTFPCTLYHALTFGSWNTLMVTNRVFDFSQLVGFKNTVYNGVKYRFHTPKALQTTWENSFKDIDEGIKQFDRRVSECKGSELAPALNWRKNEWKIFFAFKDNMRKGIKPTLTPLGISYDSYRKWPEHEDTFFTVHTGFYPEGYHTYHHICLLLFTQYKEAVMSLFSLFPTTSTFMEMGDALLAFVNVVHADVIRKVLRTVYEMKAAEMITGFTNAYSVSEYYHEVEVPLWRYQDVTEDIT